LRASRCGLDLRPELPCRDARGKNIRIRLSQHPFRSPFQWTGRQVNDNFRRRRVKFSEFLVLTGTVTDLGRHLT
jgi:hypothetical protein